MVDTKRYNDWFDAAKKDLDGAKILYDHDADYGIVCFHCQQAAEKYFKGFLIFKSGMLSEGHNLLKLCKKAIVYDKEFEAYLKDCAFLNTYYIETRYPAEDALVVTRDDVEECMEIMGKIKEFIDSIVSK